MVEEQLQKGGSNESDKNMTLKKLLDAPENRRADGSLTDAAYEAYRATSAKHPDGFIPDDELATTKTAPDVRWRTHSAGNTGRYFIMWGQIVLATTEGTTSLHEAELMARAPELLSEVTRLRAANAALAGLLRNFIATAEALL